MDSHSRALTYPAVIGLLQDGEWHADEELTAVTSFPREWLQEVEREHGYGQRRSRLLRRLPAVYLSSAGRFRPSPPPIPANATHLTGRSRPRKSSPPGASCAGR